MRFEPYYRYFYVLGIASILWTCLVLHESIFLGVVQPWSGNFVPCGQCHVPGVQILEWTASCLTRRCCWLATFSTRLTARWTLERRNMSSSRSTTSWTRAPLPSTRSTSSRSVGRTCRSVVAKLFPESSDLFPIIQIFGTNCCNVIFVLCWNLTILYCIIELYFLDRQWFRGLEQHLGCVGQCLTGMGFFLWVIFRRYCMIVGKWEFMVSMCLYQLMIT